MFGQVRCHSCIHDDLPYPQVSGHHTDGRSTCEEVHNHLRGDFLRISGNTLRYYAVVACGYDNGLTTDSRPFRSKYARQLDGNFLQTAQTARGLGKV